VGKIRQIRLVATVPTAGTGVTADSEVFHGEILKIAFDVTGNSMDINLDTLAEPKAQAILDYTGNTDSTFYPRTALHDYQGSALDPSDTEGGDTALYGPFAVFGKVRLTLASAAAAETVTLTITYRE